MSDLKEISCHTPECHIEWPENMGQCARVYIETTQQGCKGFWKTMEQISTDSFSGVIYKVCAANGSCDFVLKYIAIGNNDDTEDSDEVEQYKTDIDRETLLQMDAAEAGLAPHVWQIIETDEGVGIIMDAMDITLKQHIINNPKNVLIYMQKAIDVLRQLHQLGIYHGDMHLENFMFKDDKLYLIDFGEARSANHTVKDEKYLIKADFTRMLQEYQLLTEQYPELVKMLPVNVLHKLMV